MHDATSKPLEDFYSDRAAAIREACTSCGKCVEACPVVPFAGLQDVEPREIVGGVLTALDGEEPLNGAAGTWAHQCNGCGQCIPACPEGVNPRTMIMLANSFDARHGTATPQLFRKMSRAIRLMAAMQLVPEDVNRLLRPPAAREVDVVFYLGCNAVRTPHILFNAMYVLDALEIDYEVVGGPAACCGIIHSKWEGETATGGRVTDGTIDRFAGYTPRKVLSWCPSCQLHLGETLDGYLRSSFDFDHVTTFLVENEAELIRRYTSSVPQRVLLHAHEGMRDLGENVARLLRAIPGLTVVDIAYETGYTCGGSGADRSPALKAKQREETMRRACAPDVDALVTLYHGCHGQLVSAGSQAGVPVVNFTDLLVRALGGEPREDALAGLSSLGDWTEIAAAAAPQLHANGIAFDPDELAETLPEIFSLAEFRGGLKKFASSR